MECRDESPDSLSEPIEHELDAKITLALRGRVKDAHFAG